MVKHSEALAAYNHIWNEHRFPFNETIKYAPQGLDVVGTMVFVYVYFKQLRLNKKPLNRLGIGKLLVKLYKFLPKDKMFYQLPYYDTLVEYFTQTIELPKALVPIKELGIIAEYYQRKFS